MTLTDTHQFRPSRLWKSVSPGDRLDTAVAFWREGDEATRAQAIDAIARHLKFRHKSVMALPDDRKAQHLASLPVVPEAVASRLLIIHHLATKRPMMAAFLDALGIAHDNGVITAETIAPPDARRCERVASDLSATLPKDEVALYFATLVSQDEHTWGVLAPVVAALKD